MFFAHKIKFIVFIRHEVCSSYKCFNNILKIIKMLCSRGDFNSGSLHTTAKYIPLLLKVKRQDKQMMLQWVGSTLYQEMVEMLLQCNSELPLSKPRYGGGGVLYSHYPASV
jgi:hypothetical protein